MAREESPQGLIETVVRAVHRRQLAEHGGADGVRDEGMLQSALGRPKNLWAYGDPRADLFDLAAAYAFGLARDHPFVDGNKRTAHIACNLFLELNGWTLVASDQDKYTFMLSLAGGRLSESQYARWLRDQCRTIEPK